ncbi:unnamed protein product [Paramecium octaurelia]|uniref:Transmembrane protein n=1 Tax=Paramecium octaurelia TaxID=43137 RepID=A0A8S1YQS0_PAROT|nr:unnamed protein product [Paramecium octaurelia]CAD8214509.1 unnamed protein product [Paramecium octaurelia]CAD8214512.1 unnamed protein product [Paramecium octaurelia]
MLYIFTQSEFQKTIQKSHGLKNLGHACNTRSMYHLSNYLNIRQVIQIGFKCVMFKFIKLLNLIQELRLNTAWKVITIVNLFTIQNYLQVIQDNDCEVLIDNEFGSITFQVQNELKIQVQGTENISLSDQYYHIACFESGRANYSGLTQSLGTQQVINFLYTNLYNKRIELSFCHSSESIKKLFKKCFDYYFIFYNLKLSDKHRLQLFLSNKQFYVNKADNVFSLVPIWHDLFKIKNIMTQIDFQILFQKKMRIYIGILVIIDEVFPLLILNYRYAKILSPLQSTLLLLECYNQKIKGFQKERYEYYG